MEELKGMLRASGFIGITVNGKEKSDELIRRWDFGERVENMVFSAYIQAKRP